MVSRLCYLAVLMWWGEAHAISDDANPWLAIEGANCAAHRATDYAAQLDMNVTVDTAEWRGATLTHDMHCYVSGTLNGTPFTFGLLTAEPGAAYATSCAAADLKLIGAMIATDRATDCRSW